MKLAPDPGAALPVAPIQVPEARTLDIIGLRSGWPIVPALEPEDSRCASLSCGGRDVCLLRAQRTQSWHVGPAYQGQPHDTTFPPNRRSMSSRVYLGEQIWDVQSARSGFDGQQPAIHTG